MRIPTLAVFAMVGFVAVPAHASMPSAWAALDKASSAACIKAAGLRNAKVGPSVRYSDRLLIDARVVTGTYPQPHMKGAAGSMLCLYHRTAKRAEVQDAAKMWPAPPLDTVVKDVTWVGEHVGGQPTVHNSLVTLRFGSDGKLTGKSGCNNYSVNYQLTDRALKVYPPMIGTRMACPADIMAQEATFQDLLGRASSIEIGDDGRLTIHTANRQTLRFARE